MRLIDADALKEGFYDSERAKYTGNTIVHAIESMPTIEAEPVRHGRWIPTEYDSYADGYPVYELFECSECGNEHEGDADTLTAYCPSCGAKMDLDNANRTD